MHPCTMEQPSHWLLDLASHSQVRPWRRSSSPSSSASLFSVLPLLKSLPRTCSVLPLLPASLLVVTRLVQSPVDL